MNERARRWIGIPKVIRIQFVIALLCCFVATAPLQAEDENLCFYANGKDCWGFANDEPLLSALKGRQLNHDWTMSVGGALRYRYLDERNRLRPNPPGRSSYNQWRFSPSLTLRYQDVATLFVQGIDAATFGNELPEVPIDENRADLLQMYVDLNVMDLGAGQLHFRYGRQFLKYGSQHLISPLAWANTFRNFEGYKLYYTSKTWNIDAFAVQPVNGAAGNFYRPRSFDQPDQSVWFSGVYASYLDAPGGVIDLYWLWLKEDDDRLNRIDGNRHTLGLRYAGNQQGDVRSLPLRWDWDIEGGYQFGEEDFLTGRDQDIQAGYFSAQIGPTFPSLPWSPGVTGIFWWGSGDNNPNDGTSGTNSTLFPLGHAYWGQIDNFSGQNLLNYAVRLSVNPTPKLSLIADYHWFDKAAREDAIYNIAGAPFGGVSSSDRHLGEELDLVATYQVNQNLQLQLGYFWFWYGEGVSQNSSGFVGNRNDAEQIYFLADWSY